MPNSVNARFAISPEALESRVGDEIVLLHLKNSTYYGLDPVGTRIWELLKEGLETGAVKTRLLAEYDVEEAVITADMERFLTDLLGHGIVIAT